MQTGANLRFEKRAPLTGPQQFGLSDCHWYVAPARTVTKCLRAVNVEVGSP